MEFHTFQVFGSCSSYLKQSRELQTGFRREELATSARKTVCKEMNAGLFGGSRI